MNEQPTPEGDLNEKQLHASAPKPQQEMPHYRYSERSNITSWPQHRHLKSRSSVRFLFHRDESKRQVAACLLAGILLLLTWAPATIAQIPSGSIEINESSEQQSYYYILSQICQQSGWSLIASRDVEDMLKSRRFVNNFDRYQAKLEEFKNSKLLEFEKKILSEGQSLTPEALSAEAHKRLRETYGEDHLMTISWVTDQIDDRLSRLGLRATLERTSKIVTIQFAFTDSRGSKGKSDNEWRLQTQTVDILPELDFYSFEFPADVTNCSLATIMPSIAERVGATYSISGNAEAILKKNRCRLEARDAAKLSGGTSKIALDWRRQIHSQLQGLYIHVTLTETIEIATKPGSNKEPVMIYRRKALTVTAPDEHLVLIKTKAGIAFPTIPNLRTTNYPRGGMQVVEGAAADIKNLESQINDGLYKGIHILHGDSTGQYVLHYPLEHAWAQDMSIRSVSDATRLSAARGIESTLSNLLNDYIATPKPRPLQKPIEQSTDPITPDVIAQSTSSIETKELLQRLKTEDAALPAGATNGSGTVQLTSAPLYTQNTSETLASNVPAIGSIIAPAAGEADAARLRIEQEMGAKLIPLSVKPAAEVAGTKVRSAETPDIGKWVVVADMANNALMVVGPDTRTTSELRRLLRFLEEAIAILDAPTNMVELSAAIIDIDQNHLQEWGTRFALAGEGKFDGKPSFGRAGFNNPLVPAGAAAGTRGLFANLFDPATGAQSITAEAVAGQGLNVGALVVASSVSLLATVRALESEGDGRILSRPSVVTLDSTEAEVSEDTTFYLPSQGLNSSTLTAVRIPLSIKVLPQVVQLDEASDKKAVSIRVRIADGSTTAATTVDYGTIITSAIVTPGESLLIAGRLRNEERDAETRIPVLGRIPVVGRLFKDSSVTRQSQQRLVMITPTIVDSFILGASEKQRRLRELELRLGDQISENHASNRARDFVEVSQLKLKRLQEKFKQQAAAAADATKQADQEADDEESRMAQHLPAVSTNVAIRRANQQKKWTITANRETRQTLKTARDLIVPLESVPGVPAMREYLEKGIQNLDQQVVQQVVQQITSLRPQAVSELTAAAGNLQQARQNAEQKVMLDQITAEQTKAAALTETILNQASASLTSSNRTDAVQQASDPLQFVPLSSDSGTSPNRSPASVNPSPDAGTSPAIQPKLEVIPQ